MSNAIHEKYYSAKVILEGRESFTPMGGKYNDKKGVVFFMLSY